ncbi:MAG: hypothetical protein OEM24_05870 [Paracoccaceae bacterium]|nr:hypothetical protein [Paracoccaceae bacterium]
MLLEIARPRLLVYGCLSWLVPFLAAFPFYGPGGELNVPLPLFKSAMVVIGGGIGVVLLVLAFHRVRPSLATGLALGLLWLAINWGVDLLILIPMSGMSRGDYAADIGLRYLLLPIIAAGMGAVAARARRT